jgi:predicted N-acetyltransferase YhbS
MSDAITLRPLAAADLPFAMSLKEAAGWNQTPRDWEELLALRPAGCFLAAWEGRPAGTVTTIDYGGVLGWVGMLLVAPGLRGRGIGKRLLDAACKSLAGVATVKLDATPAGRKVYAPLGFVDEAGLERRVRAPGAGVAARADSELASHGIAPIRPEDLAAIAAFDEGAFGAPREGVLAAWVRAAPGYAFVAREAGAVQGYVLGRPGTRAEHVGPLVAKDRGVAQALLAAALAAAAGKPIAIDVFTEDAGWLGVLEQLGFAPERSFTRMRCGPDRSAGEPGARRFQWATAGPEVG